jgi:hypothetical protein
MYLPCPYCPTNVKISLGFDEAKIETVEQYNSQSRGCLMMVHTIKLCLFTLHDPPGSCCPMATLLDYCYSTDISLTGTVLVRFFFCCLFPWRWPSFLDGASLPQLYQSSSLFALYSETF